MVEIPSAVREAIRRAGEDRLLQGFETLIPADRQRLLNLITDLDLSLLAPFYQAGEKRGTVPPRERIQRAPVWKAEEQASHARALGEAALRAGRVAALMVAGGKGTRLGFDRPKGLYPIGPVSDRTLFQIHAERVAARRRRHSCSLPLLIMTSRATDSETREFFQQRRQFDLDDLHFFEQGEFPVLSLENGQPLRHADGALVTSPDGHGGVIDALAGSGLLSSLTQRGIDLLYYFQVDNPLAKIADPVFLGQHLLSRSEASSKIIHKALPEEPMGNVVLVDGRCRIIEYSDIDSDQVRWTDDNGQFLFTAGSLAIHIFDLPFLSRLATQRDSLPLHLAKKKANTRDIQGSEVVPSEPNALQFERFIFDVLPLAERYLVVETTAVDEFAPLKKASGTDSPETVRAALSAQARSWLALTGIHVPGEHPVEISPLVALESGDLQQSKYGIRIEVPVDA